MTDGKIGGETYFQEKYRVIRNFKKVILMIIYGASKEFDKKLIGEQEVLNNIADMIMNIYVTESTALRVEKMEKLKGTDAVSLYKEMLDVTVYDTADLIRKAALDALNSFNSDEPAAKWSDIMIKLTTVAGINVKNARRKIANKLIEDNSYKF